MSSRPGPEAPGAWRPTEDREGAFPRLCRDLPEGAIAILDRRVAELHPKVPRALNARRAQVLLLEAGEAAKALSVLGGLATQTVSRPRGTPVIAIGGGTLGDLATVFAHVFKRGAPLIQVPTTLLAAVDSSIGGKGAVHAGTKRRLVKNAIGVFHYAQERWRCGELFRTLNERQVKEGLTEAYKMAVCLDAALWRQYARRPPRRDQLLEDARRLKDAVCADDPYEERGGRRVLNFGHTFGHVLETLTSFRLTHGEAVGLGMLCALDVGRISGITPARVALEVEGALLRHGVALPRAHLASALRRARPDAISELLNADKKTAAPGKVRMVLLRAAGETQTAEVTRETWEPLLAMWKAGGGLR